jgi:DNA-binding CsgD family transcriptional regulator
MDVVLQREFALPQARRFIEDLHQFVNAWEAPAHLADRIAAPTIVAVRVVRHGEAEGTDEDAQKVIHHLLRTRFRLTRTQSEIALLLGRRYTNREIAGMLGISVHTVRKHVEGVLLRLELPSRLDVRRLLHDMEMDPPAVGEAGRRASGRT